jgi:hypothetical protein
MNVTLISYSVQEDFTLDPNVYLCVHGVACERDRFKVRI